MSNPTEAPAEGDAIPVSSPPQSPRRSRRGLLLALLGAAVVFGAGSMYATWRFRQFQIDPTPAARPWNNAPYITTPPDVVETLLEVADVKEGELLYDLGCGDGRIAVTAAAKYGCRARGYDIEAERIAESRDNARQQNVEELVEFEQRDVFTLDLSDADVVAMYLLPRYLERLLPQFAQMRPGARIVSHDFYIEGIPPEKTVTITSETDGAEHTIYFWTTPLPAPVKKELKL